MALKRILASRDLVINGGRRLIFGALVVFALVGLVVVRESEGIDATRWMNIFDASDFSEHGAVGKYLIELQVPIPVALSLAEIFSFKCFGSTALVTRWGYRLCLVGAFLSALWLARGSRLRLLVSMASGLVFLGSTVLIHPGNAQNYDVFFPFCMLGFFVSLASAAEARTNRGPGLLLCIGAGFFLGMAELLRPFVVFLVPLLLVGSHLALRGHPRRFKVALWVPVLLLSGGWHAVQWVQHGQIIWSNHSGFNLARAWPGEMPAVIQESADNKVANDRWMNINTPEHRENSRRLRKAVFEFAVAHPVYTASNVLFQSFLLGRAATALYDYRPDYWILRLYRPVVWAALSWTFVHLVRLLWLTVRRRASIGVVDHLLLVSTGAFFLLLALGETEEQARMLVSLLPLLAAWPGVVRGEPKP